METKQQSRAELETALTEAISQLDRERMDILTKSLPFIMNKQLCDEFLNDMYSLPKGEGLTGMRRILALYEQRIAAEQQKAV